MLGIPPPGRAQDRASTWENAPGGLCVENKPELFTRHAAIADK